MKKFFILLVIASLFCSCSNRQSTISLNEAAYVIDLDENQEVFIPYSSIFKNVQTIILETGEDCMIGNITEFQVFDGCIYILDESVAKSLFVFDMEGRFIRKIGSLGNGPGEYIKINDFTVDTENGFIFLCDYANRVHKYQLDGTYIHSITIGMPRANTNFIQYYKGILYASVFAWDPAENDYMLLGIDPNDGKILSRALPLKYNKGWAELIFTGHSFFTSRMNSPPRYAQLFMDEIVSIGDDISPYIQLKSKNLVTEKDLENLPKDNDFAKMLESFRGSSKIWNVHSFIENDDFILFKYTCGYLGSSYTVVFHKETQTVKITKYLGNDMILEQDHDTWFVNFRFADMQGAYEIIPTFMMSRFMESIRNNKLVPNLDKLDQLKKLNEESNPVIFFYEFK